MNKLLIPLILIAIGSSQAEATELVTLYIGEGPSLNLSFSPKMTFLKGDDHVTDVGIYYVVREAAGIEKHLLQVQEATILPQAVAAMLFYRTLDLIQKKTGHFGALLPEDTLYIANKLLSAPGFSYKVIQPLQNCAEVLTYLKDQSSTVYPQADLDAVTPLFCR